MPTEELAYPAIYYQTIADTGIDPIVPSLEEVPLPPKPRRPAAKKAAKRKVTARA